jgi:hypothetical protein
VVGSCEHGDEPSGSGTTELVFLSQGNFTHVYIYIYMKLLVIISEDFDNHFMIRYCAFIRYGRKIAVECDQLCYKNF